MKTLLSRIDYHRSIHRVLSNNSDAFEGKTVLTAALEDYAATTGRISEITSGLVYPVTFVRRERVTLSQQLREEVSHMSDNGCMIAKKTQ